MTASPRQWVTTFECFTQRVPFFLEQEDAERREREQRASQLRREEEAEREEREKEKYELIDKLDKSAARLIAKSKANALKRSTACAAATTPVVQSSAKLLRAALDVRDVPYVPFQIPG